MTVTCNEAATRKTLFEFPHALNFPALDIKNIVTFRHNFAYMVNSFIVSLDITVIINILQ